MDDKPSTPLRSAPVESPPTTVSASGGPDPMPSPGTAKGYAGDVSPQQAWQWAQAGEGLIVDVRSDAEREWVGTVPTALPLAWKQWPGMALNPRFDDELRQLQPNQRLLMLCRSGVRSIAAAKRATELGFEAWNILEGFEGDPDARQHRGHKGGWRYHDLPWRQG